MPLCTCGHEQHEHNGHEAWEDAELVIGTCTRAGCMCPSYTERPVLTQSDWDLPVSQGARDLRNQVAELAHTMSEAMSPELYAWDVLDILAAADERDVRNLLWARRAGKL